MSELDHAEICWRRRRALRSAARWEGTPQLPKRRRSGDITSVQPKAKRSYARCGDIVIKVDPTRGSPALAMGTQHLKAGAGILVHRHDLMDEILLIQEGRGFAILDDQRTPIAKGSTIFVPKGFWHGFENPEIAMDLVWIVTPPGLEAFFREVGGAPGAPPKALTREQFRAIGEKHGTIFRS
jgi:quercetin dioxygenase-like cupin family protein